MVPKLMARFKGTMSAVTILLPEAGPADVESSRVASGHIVTICIMGRKDAVGLRVAFMAEHDGVLAGLTIE